MLTQDEREALETLLEEAAETLDQIVELCRKDDYLSAYVPDNLWASRYGYLGKGVLDTLEDWLREAQEDDGIDGSATEGDQPLPAAESYGPQ